VSYLTARCRIARRGPTIVDPRTFPQRPLSTTMMLGCNASEGKAAHIPAVRRRTINNVGADFYSPQPDVNMMPRAVMERSGTRARAGPLPIRYRGSVRSVVTRMCRGDCWPTSGTTNSTTRWSRMWWLASASSTNTRCGPGGKFWMMTGIPLASAQSQGRSSTITWRCPIRGETASAAGPNTGTIRTFSARYWRTTTPRASGAGRGESTTTLGWLRFSERYDAWRSCFASRAGAGDIVPRGLWESSGGA
jgi:hypothetical protein